MCVSVCAFVCVSVESLWIKSCINALQVYVCLRFLWQVFWVFPLFPSNLVNEIEVLYF